MAFRPTGTIRQIPQALDGEAISAGLSGEGEHRICRCRGGLQAGLWLVAIDK